MRKPLVLAVDDDPEFNDLVKIVLSKLGIASEFFLTAETFLERLKDAKPSLCLIDVNIGRLGIGFQIVKAVRRTFGGELPLLVTSSLADNRSITHAIEIGANDYLVKPLDLEILASKLKNYLSSAQLMANALKLFPVPEGESFAYLNLPLEVVEVDELGLKLLSRHLLLKGALIEVSGHFIEEISGGKHSLLVSVTSTWLEGSFYGAYAEFDSTNEGLLRSVRKWMTAEFQRMSVER